MLCVLDHTHEGNIAVPLGNALAFVLLPWGPKRGDMSPLAWRLIHLISFAGLLLGLSAVLACVADAVPGEWMEMSLAVLIGASLAHFASHSRRPWTVSRRSR